MRTKLSSTLKLLVALLLVAGLFGASHASAASLPTSPCVSSTGATACHLYATTGTAALFGTTSVNIWGYSASNTPGSATLPGPILIVKQGDTVTVTLDNLDIPEATALLFQGQSMIPDTIGISSGGSKVYTFVATRPGTFLYEAGLIQGKQHQVAMGMYGALVVRPSVAPPSGFTGQAYASATTAFHEETVLVLSEIDTTLNTIVPAVPNANPAAFDLRNYAPKYFLINGKAYANPFTGDIPATAGNKVLLRYVNAGLQSHAMSTLGIAQSAIAMDGHALSHPHSMVTETIATGQTLDTLVTLPGSTAPGTKFAIYDANLMLRNSNASGFGGMLTFLTSGGSGVGGGGPDITGPTASSPGLSPNPTNGSSTVTVSASISDVASGNHNVSAAEFYIDSTAASPTVMTGTFGTSTVSVTGTIPVATLASLTSGSHTIFVRGKDSVSATANWGAFTSIILVLDKTGPTTSGLALSPNPSSGTVSVALSATGNDTISGNSNVAAAEYWVDGAALHTAMTPSGSASPTRNFTATIPAGLTLGTHVISVRSQDSFGNWGAAATINLQVADTAAPTTNGVSASPNPNNGSTPYNTSVPAVRVFASFTDATTGNSNLAAAEGFLDTVAANGTGFVFIASDGTFNTPTEVGYSDIPIAVVGTLTSGSHTIYVHAKDAAGNWGAMATTVLVIEKVPPLVSAVTLTPPASNNTAVVVSATANDTATGNSNIGGGEYFIDSAGAVGTGSVMTPAAALPNTTISATIPAATVAALTTGSHTVYVRAKDVAGNWSTTATGSLLIDRTPPTFSSITLNPSSIPSGTATINLTVNGTSDGVGGSGVAGGEYWFGTTNITAGTGTAFTGLTNVPIATSSLTAGTYTVRVRVRDVAGNWSTGNNGVRTATLTVTGVVADAIFSNGFETGSRPWGWTSASTNTTSRLNVSATAALIGSLGLQAQGNNTNYVQYDFGTGPNPATGTFDTRFYFNPNGFTPNAGGNVQDIFAAATSSGFGTQVFHVRYRMNAGQPQVQIQVGTTANASWFNINNNAGNRIEVLWQTGTSLTLYVNGVLTQTIATASTGSVASFRLGSVTDAGNNANATLEYFDALSAKRSVSPLIGP